ncbi:MAG: type II toxin-antitoxin system RelE/ParE family toxin [Xanthomonadales bacterium]|nr:type II toxin-antitoxin system RelE/ParE family toxin [Xanthomonadales bacterium]
MAEVVWTEPALADLEAIADYIAVENPEAASSFVQRVIDHIDQLQDHPLLGPIPSDLEDSRYRHIIESPCRIFYRQEGQQVFIVHVMRSERLLIPDSLDRG